MRQPGGNLYYMYNTLADNEQHSEHLFIFTAEVSREGFMILKFEVRNLATAL